MAKDNDYIFILKALQEIPFGVGRKLLISFLQGKYDVPSIERNNLQRLDHFGSLSYNEDEITELINRLQFNHLIQLTPIRNNKHIKVYEITQKGISEIKNPKLNSKTKKIEEQKTIITENDKKIFQLFGEFLKDFNDLQKKAIISDKSSILCIAGAGSGKTTVLTKRIELLVKFRSVDPKKILAITFTRKAKNEMIKRISSQPFLSEVSIHTFNSFCENLLRQYSYLVYSQPVRVISYRDKIMIIRKALTSLNLGIQRAINIYFNYGQTRGRSQEQLANLFMNDCFFVRDYLKFKNKPLTESEFNEIDNKDKTKANLVFKVCKFIDRHMTNNGLRDFADQLLDTISFFKLKPEYIPQFDHILIDEYQDINSTQIKVMDLLKSKNIFCVGDPRQSIYGWRGSDISYIINYKQKYDNAEIITLTKNYRSTKPIVNLINHCIKPMNLADLESNSEGKKEIFLKKFPTENEESNYVINKIKKSILPRNEIFVLARTNRQLKEISDLMKLNGIKHITRTDEIRKTTLSNKDDITLATIHAIKGLEAEQVFVIGCTYSNFPCKGSDHPVIEMIKVDEYNKEEEERRLFYVSLSRAKTSLYLTYSGKSPTYFITNHMKELLQEDNEKLENNPIKSYKFNSNNHIASLKNWRSSLAREQNIPPYIIMHDKTLLEIASELPTTTKQLAKIHGMGPAKIHKYGEDILQILNG